MTMNNSIFRFFSGEMLKILNRIKENGLILLLKNSILELPTPSFIRYLWNWGFLLGIVLMIQLITGLVLASHYNSHMETAFYSVIHIIRDVNAGYTMRFFHINGASLFFVFIYCHIFRGIIIRSYKNRHTWLRGIFILLFLIGAAFLGYVLPWGQMSYWGATVITNLASAIPFLGNGIVQWLWGGFSIRQATLTRFFMLHFLLPFVLTSIVLIHIFFLHEKGSSNPLGVSFRLDKVPFKKFFAVKDTLTIFIWLIVFIFFVFLIPFALGDPENFIPANPLRTPIHIIPEWYFLFAYSILRAIPNKLGGVIALLFSILIFTFHVRLKKNFKTLKFNPFKKIFCYIFLFLFLILTWLGGCVVEAPYERLRKFIRIIYFLVVFFV